jgi:hypothetical protein
MALALGSGAPARADFFLITNRAAVGATDSVDWGVLGPPFTVVPNPFMITSASGRPLTVSQMTGPFERRDQGFPAGGWNGNFAPGDHLLWTRGALGSSGPITVNFGPVGIYAGGAQIQPDFADGNGNFMARITALDANGNVLDDAIFMEAGVSTNAADNSAIFIGIGTTDTPINQLRFKLFMAPSPVGDFAINRLDFLPVPEPGSLGLLGVGALGLLSYIWRRQKRKL